MKLKLKIKIATQYNQKKGKKNNNNTSFKSKRRKVIGQKQSQLLEFFLIKKSKISNIPCMHILVISPPKKREKETNI